MDYLKKYISFNLFAFYGYFALGRYVDSIIYNYPDGWVLVNMSVNTTNTYGNKIFPGNYIDIYVKAVNKIDEDNMTSKSKDKIPWRCQCQCD